MRAPLPNIGFRCPHCKVALKYAPVLWGYIGLLILLCLPLLLGLAAVTVYLWGATIPVLAAYFAVALAIWLPFEWAIARRHRARSRLALK